VKTIAYDTELNRPGCAIVQATMGATPGIANSFDERTWLVSITDAMRVYPVTDEQLAILVATARRREE
jgi:hypothetical protein